MRSLPILLSSLFLSFTEASSNLQHPLQAPLRAMTPKNGGDNPSKQPSVPLADILGTYRSLTTFSSLARSSSPIESLLADLNTNTTILAPLNSAIDSLPHKPWEDPADYNGLGTNAYEGDEGRDRAQKNLQSFVEAHLVTTSPWVEGEEGGKTKTVAGEGKARELWWVKKDGKKIIMPDGVEVDQVASQVANGEVWILKGVLNYLENETKGDYACYDYTNRM